MLRLDNSRGGCAAIPAAFGDEHPVFAVARCEWWSKMGQESIGDSPLVEAMASGVPIVASDLPVHREICGDAARYAPTFSPQGFAEEILSVIGSPQQKQQLAEAGRRRSAKFSWVDHVDQICRIAKQLTSVRSLRLSAAAAVVS